ncbi:MAG: hypothetical protein Q4D14_05085 [Bacteroidales bacterium]|nr:hypothetical protein [Bacteroidales bacterium]
MQKYRSYVFPTAIILGALLHNLCNHLMVVVPYAIFSILLLNFCAVKLRTLRIQPLDIPLIAFQTIVPLLLYATIKHLTKSEEIAQGAMICVLCPVASSVVVVAVMLGANRETCTMYTVLGNLLTIIIAPIYFSFIGTNQALPLGESMWNVFSKITPVIGFPLIIALICQQRIPKVNTFLAKGKNLTFYLWAFCIFAVLGNTFHKMITQWNGDWNTLIIVIIVSAIICFSQFIIGKLIGRRHSDPMAAGQLLGQKNTGIGIWMANFYLSPLAAVALACYSVWQNVFNSLQMWLQDHKKQTNK